MTVQPLSALEPAADISTAYAVMYQTVEKLQARTCMLVTKCYIDISVLHANSRMRHTSQLQPSAALQQVQLDWMLLQESTVTTHSMTLAMSSK